MDEAWGGWGEWYRYRHYTVIVVTTVTTVLIFDFQGQIRSGVISRFETSGFLTVICRPEALNNRSMTPLQLPC